MAPAEPVRLTVHIDDENPRPISTDLWGVFFEDINYAADGGLYAELIRNRSFSFSAVDRPDWHALTGWETLGHVEHQNGALLPILLDATTGPASITNQGFDGISVRAGARYILRLRATAPAPGAELDIELLGPGDTPLATASIALGPEEVAHRIVMTSAATQPGSSLRVSLPHGRAAVGLVSLFPEETFGGDNGLRPDLASAIADLRPRFVRFPGGCIAHGMGLQNLYNWKETLGPVEGRTQNFNLWGYHQSMGLGYYEYFRFCAQIGAKPLPVVAAGVCCQNVLGGQQAIPDDEFDAYIQDVLDLIEYANGPVSSRWGSRRAEAGHPEPFGLEYLGIGNEDEITDQFTDRFQRLFEAVGVAHPEITVIGTAGPFPFGSDYERGWELARRLAVPIVDEHSYKAPSWYFQHLDRFDGYDRSGPAVYIGEYGSRGNSLLCALAEAAYMMGMERNGDIVRLASYAPLLAKIDRTQWVPDLIYFDNERVLPTFNYHVQRMHAMAAGDASLPVTTSGVPEFTRGVVPGSSVAVKAQTGTLAIQGARITGSDIVTVSAEGSDRFTALPLSTDLPDYTIQLRVELVNGCNGFIVAFGAVDSDNDAFEWHLGTWGNRFHMLQRRTDGITDDVLEPVPMLPKDSAGGDLEIRVTGRGERVVCVFNGVTIFDFTDSGLPERRISVAAVSRSTDRAVFVKAVNATGQPAVLDVTRASGEPVRQGDTVSLSAEPDAGEPFQEAPAEPVSVVGVDHSRGIPLPPFSFTIVRLDPADSSTTLQ